MQSYQRSHKELISRLMLLLWITIQRIKTTEILDALASDDPFDTSHSRAYRPRNRGAVGIMPLMIHIADALLFNWIAMIFIHRRIPYRPLLMPFMSSKLR